LQASAAEEPSNIKWENIPYPEWKRNIRKTFAIIISLIVILSTFGIVILQKSLIDSITQDYDPNINCGYISHTENELYSEFLDSTIQRRSKVKTACFCQHYLATEGISKTQDFTFTLEGKSYFVCSDWMDSWIKYQGASTGVIILVPFVNIILSIILRSNIN
jgi:hypothetical protein